MIDLNFLIFHQGPRGMIDFNFLIFYQGPRDITPVAGLIFETKNRAIFLERFFGRENTAREQVSRAVILARF